MAEKKITQTSIKQLQPGETIWDTELNGFGCRCQQKAKTFIVKYRHGKGRTGIQRFYTIGKLGKWTPDMARDEAKKILGQVNNGKDPAATRKQEKELLHLQSGFEVFLEEVKAKKKPKTHAAYQWLFEKIIEPKLGKYRIDLINHKDIDKLHASLESTPYQANRVLALLSVFFSWCDKKGHRSDGLNPCRHVEKFEETSRERFLSETEVYALGKALNDYEEENKHLKEQPHKKTKESKKEENISTKYIVAAIRLLLLTGARRNEILTLKWTDVDFERKLIRLQESKTGQKTIYLSAPALQILSDIPRIEGNPFVICGRKEGSHLVNIKDAWGDIRKRAGLEDVRIHDLRHNYASTAVVSGHHLKVIGSLLGHSNTKTTERYSHLANDPLQTANEAISRRILDAMTNEPKKDNIHNLS